MGFVEPEVVISDGGIFIPNIKLYHFGILTSSIHMAWMRLTAGRFGIGYRYGRDTVYNTFPWCEPSDKQREAIELTAQKILDVRAKYMKITRSEDQKITSKSATTYDLMNLSSCDLSNGATLADLYDELSMPRDLRDAHKKNDRAVAAAYGLEKIFDDESAVIVELLKLYAKNTRGD